MTFKLLWLLARWKALAKVHCTGINMAQPGMACGECGACALLLETHTALAPLRGERGQEQQCEDLALSWAHLSSRPRMR